MSTDASVFNNLLNLEKITTNDLDKEVLTVEAILTNPFLKFERDPEDNLTQNCLLSRSLGDSELYQLVAKHGDTPEILATKVHEFIVVDGDSHKLIDRIKFYYMIQSDISTCPDVIRQAETAQYVLEASKQLLDEVAPPKNKEGLSTYIANYCFNEYDLEFSVGTVGACLESINLLFNQFDLKKLTTYDLPRKIKTNPNIFIPPNDIREYITNEDISGVSTFQQGTSGEFNGSESWILKQVLFGAGHGITLTYLYDRLRFTRGYIKKLVGTLERQGFINKSVSSKRLFPSKRLKKIARGEEQ
jgi:hypothetical protein